MLKIYSNEHIQFPNEKKTGTRTLTKSNCKIIQKPFLVIFFFISTLRDISLSGCWTNHLRIQKTTCLFFWRLLARGFLFQNVIQFLFSFSKQFPCKPDCFCKFKYFMEIHFLTLASTSWNTIYLKVSGSKFQI